jgi:hypothetical protein
MKRFDQGHLNPLLEHPETNMSRQGIEPGPPASQASTLANSIRTAYAVAIRNLYSTEEYVQNGLEKHPQYSTYRTLGSHSVDQSLFSPLRTCRRYRYLLSVLRIRITLM